MRGCHQWLLPCRFAGPQDHNKYGWDNYGYSDTDSYSRDRRRFKEGELRDSYHKDGHSSYGLDKYEQRGYGKDSYKHVYDKDGYDQDGYDKHGEWAHAFMVCMCLTAGSPGC